MDEWGDSNSLTVTYENVTPSITLDFTLWTITGNAPDNSYAGDYTIQMKCEDAAGNNILVNLDFSLTIN